MAKKKTKEGTEFVEADIKSFNDEMDLREALTPFATWAWGNAETAQKVIDKYFKQVINK